VSCLVKGSTSGTKDFPVQRVNHFEMFLQRFRCLSGSHGPWTRLHGARCGRDPVFTTHPRRLPAPKRKCLQHSRPRRRLMIRRRASKTSVFSSAVSGTGNVLYTIMYVRWKQEEQASATTNPSPNLVSNLNPGIWVRVLAILRHLTVVVNSHCHRLHFLRQDSFAFQDPIH
jgi:hypothetical protein